MTQLTRAYDDWTQFEQAIINRLEDPAYFCFAAYDQHDSNWSGKLVGTATLFIERKCGGVAGHIEDVVVDESYRGQGIGKQLVERCIKEAKTLGCYKVVLDCSSENQAFYERCGFQENGVCMRMDLDEKVGVPE